MKNSLFGILIFLGLLFTYACDEDSFSQVVEIDVPVHTPRLVLNSIVDDGGQEILADISISRGILDDAEGLLISDATIRLLSDKGLIGIADYDPNLNKYRWSKTGAEIRGAEEVQISADANGYLSVNATDVWPTKVSLSSVRVEQDGGISLDGYVNDLIEVTFQDPPGEENYYALDAFIDFEYFYVEPNGDTMRFADANHLYMDTNDPLIGYSNNYGLIFTDAAFDGKEVKIEALASVFRGEEVESVKVELVSMSKNAYLYERSFTNYTDSDGNPFAEPVTVHSNMENGYGIFALTSRSSKTVPLD